MDRRDALVALAGGTAVALSSRALSAEKDAGKGAPQAAPQGPGKHVVQPLPFDPAKLKGLSAQLIVSHHDNNYAGAVKNLNKVEELLAQAPKEQPPFVFADLKQNELTFANSMILHEQYFGNLGGSGPVQGPVEQAVAAAYGSAATWEEQFRATALGLAGGSGWVVLAWDFPANQVRTVWSGNHTQALAFAQPLLVMDMYEHAYALDYGAAAAKYVDAFFANVKWDEVNRRLERARKAAAILRA